MATTAMGCSRRHVSFLLLLVILLLAAAASHAAHGAAINEAHEKEEKKDGVLIGSQPPNCEGRCRPSCAGQCKSVLIYWSPPAAARKMGGGAVPVMPSRAPDYKPLQWACQCLPN